MKLIFTLVLICYFSLGVFAQEDAVKGVWYNTEKTSKIKIFKATDGKYYGKIVWMKTPDKKDVNNPDPGKRNNPVFEMLIVKDFTYDASKKQWTGGNIYDPDNGKTYSCYMWFEGGQTEILHLKGYVMGMKFIGREVEWTRTEN